MHWRAVLACMTIAFLVLFVAVNSGADLLRKAEYRRKALQSSACALTRRADQQLRQRQFREASRSVEEAVQLVREKRLQNPPCGKGGKDVFQLFDECKGAVA